MRKGRTGRFALRAEPCPYLECVAVPVNARECIRRKRNGHGESYPPQLQCYFGLLMFQKRGLRWRM